MANLPPSSEGSHGWSPEALALAAQAKVLSGNKLEQLVVRLQRNTGRPSEQCWRFVIQYGLKGRVANRRWTDEEVEFVREEIVKRSVDEIAKKLGRTPQSVRSMLQRNRLGVREIRCDLFSLESLARALHIRKDEIRLWIEQGWLQASVSTDGRRRSYTITPESLADAYKRHLPDLWYSQSISVRSLCPIRAFAEAHGRRTTSRCPPGQAGTSGICGYQGERSAARVTGGGR